MPILFQVSRSIILAFLEGTPQFVWREGGGRNRDCGRESAWGTVGLVGRALTPSGTGIWSGEESFQRLTSPVRGGLTGLAVRVSSFVITDR